MTTQVLAGRGCRLLERDRYSQAKAMAKPRYMSDLVGGMKRRLTFPARRKGS
jgi:hypothetical protein